MGNTGRDGNWRRASGCESHACVEVALGADQVRVRGSREPDGPILAFGPDEWRRFCAAVAAGEFDPPGAGLP